MYFYFTAQLYLLTLATCLCQGELKGADARVMKTSSSAPSPQVSARAGSDRACYTPRAALGEDDSMKSRKSERDLVAAGHRKRGQKVPSSARAISERSESKRADNGGVAKELFSFRCCHAWRAVEPRPLRWMIEGAHRTATRKVSPVKNASSSLMHVYRIFPPSPLLTWSPLWAATAFLFALDSGCAFSLLRLSSVT